MGQSNKENMRTILINPGFYNFKGENGVIFKTAVTKSPYNSLGSLGDVIKYNNSTYIIGDGETLINADKTSNQITKLCVLNMICRQIPLEDKGGDFTLYVTAPPLSYNDQQTEIPKYLKGHYSIEYKGVKKDINIVEVEVFPETILALMAARLNGNIKKNAIIFDIGGVTSTIVRVLNGNASMDDILSDKMGMHKLEFKIFKALSKVYYKYNIIDENNMTKILTEGAINPTTNVNILEESKSIIENIYIEFIQELNRRIEKSDWIIDESYDIILTGGGSKLLYETIKEFSYPQAIMSDNPLFDNLIGLQIIKKMRG